MGLGSANAAVWVLTPTSNASGNTVAASANITASGNLLTIDLTNLSPSLSAANQALSDLIINYTTDLTGVSGFTQAGNLINIASNGATTPVAGAPDRWSASIVTGNLFLTSLGGGQPDDMIAPATIGSPNASVLNFVPYINTTGHFTMTVNNASQLAIQGVQFSFGTAADEFVAGGHCTGDCPVINPTGGGIPEPGTWALMILGFGGAGAMLRLRRRGLRFAG
jgi:hypothetical protein